MRFDGLAKLFSPQRRKARRVSVRNSSNLEHGIWQLCGKTSFFRRISGNISKSWGKSAGVGRHFICHHYWRGIKPHPTINKPEFIENLRFRFFNFFVVPNPESRFQRETVSKIPSEAKPKRGTCQPLRNKVIIYENPETKSHVSRSAIRVTHL